ncbi:putative permease [Methanosarcina barkeri str. Wiesmoor]|uniref:Putative permease n=1 Tax=Methanosarcina barkeri str. Wiesmoor TaxID=1434109 RepID=A0A0E3LKT2_METBA|nr:MFS transporter [Methanosarcina barkeri]AKB50066.1 putative permease [Methanosarcina barkeri str. Wiesmoor]
MIARFIEGSACGAFFQASFVILSKLNNPGRYLGELTFLFNAGLATGAFLSGLLADTYLKGAILVFTILTFFLITYLFSRYRRLVDLESSEKAGTLKSSSLFRKPYRETKKLLDRSNFGLWLSSFLLNGAIGVLVAYYPDYMGTITKAQLGISISSLYVCAMITSLFGGHFKVKEKTLIKIGLGFSVLGALCNKISLAGIFKPRRRIRSSNCRFCPRRCQNEC